MRNVITRALLGIMKRRQELNFDFRSMSPQQWFYEYSLIKINGVRRIGHTSAIYDIINDCDGEVKITIFFANSESLKRFAKRLNDCKNIKMLLSSEYNDMIESELVIVDDTSWVEKSDLINIYSKCIQFINEGKSNLTMIELGSNHVLRVDKKHKESVNVLRDIRYVIENYAKYPTWSDVKSASIIMDKIKTILNKTERGCRDYDNEVDY